MLERLVVAGVIVAAVMAVSYLFVAWRRRTQAGPESMPTLPPGLINGAARTWVVFTSPYCASCEPVIERIRIADPSARVVTVDASRQPDLAGAYSVRTAPTVLQADASGRVQRRLVGATAVEALSVPELSATDP